jgi:hypothetical protein
VVNVTLSCNSTGFSVAGNDTVVFGGSSCSSSGDIVVGPNSTLIISGSPVVAGDLIVAGTVVVTSGNVLIVGGRLVLLDTSSLQLEQPTAGQVPLQVRLTMTFAGSLLVKITVSLFSTANRRRDVIVAEAVTTTPSVPAGTPLLDVPLVSYASYSGAFSDVAATFDYADSACDVYPVPPQAAYGGSSMSVVLAVTRDPSRPGCQVSGGLSPGAIAGIAVGCVVGAALLTFVVVVVWRRKELAARSAQFNKQMAKRQINDAQRP